MRTISYKGGRWVADCIKSAALSTGYRVYLFKRYFKEPVVKPVLTGEFVIAIKDSNDCTKVWDTEMSLKIAITKYLDYLACYA